MIFRPSLLAASALLLTAAAASAAAAAPSAEQIVEKAVAASGGLTAWRSVQTMTVSGKLDAGGKDNHQLPFVMKLKRPNKSRIEVVFNEKSAVQVYDGAQGWKVRPFLNRNDAEPYTAEQLKSAAVQDELDGPLVDYAAKGTSVVLVGSEAVEGHPAYKLKLTSRAGVQRNVWIDSDNFLELKIDGEPRVLDGRAHKVEIYYRDYRSENGLTTPRLIETAVEGVKVNHKMQISQVTINEKLDDALFQKPKGTAPASMTMPAAPAVPAGATPAKKS